MHKKFLEAKVHRRCGFLPGSRDMVFRVIFVFLLLFPLSTSANSGVGILEKVSLQLKWHHQFQFAGYYAAKELGFYSRAGFDVDIIEGGPKIKVQDVVTSGRADFGVLGSELLFLRSQGEKLVVLAPIIQHSIRVILARKDRNINSPHDLAGKRIMLNQSEIPEFAAMFLNEGVNIKGISIINKDKTANSRFIEGRIDGLNGSIANQPYLFAREKVPFTIIRPVAYGIDFYGDALFTTQNHVKKRTHLLFEYTRLRDLILPDLVQIGHNNPERWQHIADTYIRLGLIDPDFSLKGLLYEDYVKSDYFWLKGLSIILGLMGITLSILERCGYLVQTAMDGGQAISMYQEAQEAGTPFDIVIMDLTIPGGMGGEEAIKDLLTLDPGIRAIVSSGYADDPVMANPVEYGFMDRVEKPYTKSLLEEVVGRVLKG